ncbi:murein hydrolase activator EnvC family protein [Metabacillus sp. RGM 3146]|uniref:murein hydrolase activator EnvC family protein n=1 Tax=Metabacillus sp. RGM 3146 TaxID=3401092 RepID=UPI003B9C49C5
MNRKIMSWGLAAVVGTSGVLIPLNSNPVIAQTLEEKQQDIRNQQSGVNSNIKAKQEHINELKQKEAKLNEEIKSLDMKVSATSGKIQDKQAEVDQTKQNIEEAKKQIAIVKDRIQKRNELLKNRARSLQESGGMISYLDVLLGAQNFSDFISRMSAVSTIVDADKEIIKAAEKDMNLLEQKEAELNSDLQKLQSALSELESLKETLNKQMNDKNVFMQSVQKEQGDTEDDVLSLQDQSDLLSQQDQAIQKEIARAKAADEQRKRAAAEAARLAQENARKAQENRTNGTPAPSADNSSDSGSSSSGSASKSPATGSGDFIKPTVGYFTSGFGYRIHPITHQRKLHAGIDFGNPAPNVPVYAAADGTVVHAAYSSSYGNVVYISHSIHGKIYTTVYAHQERLLVHSGQTVKQGQQIGIMGNTGHSTGKHLHFEIHDGPWEGAGNAVNPLDYINK